MLGIGCSDRTRESFAVTCFPFSVWRSQNMQKGIVLETFTFEGGLMRIFVVTMLMFVLVQPLSAQAASIPSTAQEELEQLFLELKGALKELNGEGGQIFILYKMKPPQRQK